MEVQRGKLVSISPYIHTSKITMHMKLKSPLIPLIGWVLISGFFPFKGFAQNIYSGERVQIVGAFQGYTTTPYGTDYRTTTYRRVSIDSTNPTDGRGQWVTTINVQNTGGDVTPTNMLGGGGNGFLFISGPLSSPYTNKWAFNGKGQAANNAVNNVTYNGSTDMGLYMMNQGYYTFTFNDAGYTSTNAKFFVSFTAAPPVTVMRMNDTYVGADSMMGTIDTAIAVQIMTDRPLSIGEQVFVRYIKSASLDFGSGTPSTVVQATGSGTSFTATVPFGVKYYVFTSTRTLAALTTETESNKSLSVLNFDDNNGKNYVAPVQLPIAITSFTGKLSLRGITLSWKTATELNADHFDVLKLKSGVWTKIASIAAKNLANGSSYTYLDEVYGDNNTYRLKMVDKDGSYTYGKTLSIIPPTIKENISIYPTVIHEGVINIRLKQSVSGSIQVTIASIDGKMMQSKLVKVVEGLSVLPYAVSNLPNGTYLIKVETATDKKVEKFFVE